MGYRIIKIDLELGPRGTQTEPISNARQICFVRYAWKSQATPKSKFTQDLLQISLDGNDQFFPFLPYDKISKTPGEPPFRELKYRVLWGIAAWAFILIADDYCTYGIGPHEEIAMPTKNITTGDDFYKIESSAKINILAGALNTVLTKLVSLPGVLFLFGFNIYEVGATQVDYEVEVLWNGVAKRCYGRYLKDSSQIKVEYPKPLEFICTSILGVSLNINVRNLDGLNAGDFCGSMNFAYMPTYPYYNWPEEIDGR